MLVVTNTGCGVLRHLQCVMKISMSLLGVVIRGVHFHIAIKHHNQYTPIQQSPYNTTAIKFKQQNY